MVSIASTTATDRHTCKVCPDVRPASRMLPKCGAGRDGRSGYGYPSLKSRSSNMGLTHHTWVPHFRLTECKSALCGMYCLEVGRYEYYALCPRFALIGGVSNSDSGVSSHLAFMSRSSCYPPTRRRIGKYLAKGIPDPQVYQPACGVSMFGKQPAPRENFFRVIYYKAGEHTDTRRRTYMLPRESHPITESFSQVHRAPIGPQILISLEPLGQPGYNNRSHEKFRKFLGDNRTKRAIRATCRGGWRHREDLLALGGAGRWRSQVDPQRHSPVSAGKGHGRLTK